MKKLIDSDKLFESTTVPLIDLVNSAHKFKVPEFQRDYDWKTGEKGEVHKLLTDIYETMNSDEENKIYFLGPIITYKEEKSSDHLLIDGQQRFTTMILLISALRDLIDKDSDEYLAYDEYINFIDKSKAGSRKKTPRLKVSNNDAKQFFNELITGTDLSKIHTEGAAYNLHKAYVYCKKYLASPKFGLGGDLSDSMDFVNFMLDNVCVTWIEAKDLNKALIVFERMNDRGKPLSVSDLIKYQLFTGQNIDDLGDMSQEINNRWTMLNKTLASGENTRYAKMDRFFKYFITSKYLDDGVLQVTEIINWIKKEKNKEKLKITDPPVFLNNVEKEIKNYIDIYSKNVIKHNSHIKNLPLIRMNSFAKDVTQHRPILMAAMRKKIENDEMFKLMSSIENLTFVWKLTKSQWNIIEQNLGGWCTEIRKGITVDEFINKNITSLITKRSEAISYELQNMEDKNRTLRKYILLRMENYLRDLAKMPVEWYDWSRVMDEEHILPQNFTDEDIQTSRSETSKLIWRLGNLTILTPYVNNEANNDPVSDKYERDIFASSEYVLSKLLQSDYIESKPKGSKGQNKLLIRLGLSSIKLEENQYWTENQILEREQQFYNIFNEILFGIDEKLGKAEDILKVPKF